MKPSSWFHPVTWECVTRSIIDGLQLGARGGVPNGHGDQNVRQRSQKNSQNSNRTNSRGRATFKALHECLKLHLSATFISAMLLTRGYFLILFKNKEGAISTKKLTTVEWSGLSLSFLRYTPNFDASAQGAEALLKHMIKVQFPDLHK